MASGTNTVIDNVSMELSKFKTLLKFSVAFQIGAELRHGHGVNSTTDGDPCARLSGLIYSKWNSMEEL